MTTTGHWADDGYVFAGGPRFKGNAGFLVRNFTMQTLIDGDAASQTAGSGDHAYSFNGSSSYFNFRVVKNSFDGSAANSFCWVAQGGTYMYFHAPDNQYGFATGIQDFDNKKAMMFPDTTISTEYVKDGTYGAQRLYHEFTSMRAIRKTSPSPTTPKPPPPPSSASPGAPSARSSSSCGRHPPRAKEVLCANGRMLYLSLYAPEAARPDNATLHRRCHEMGDVVVAALSAHGNSDSRNSDCRRDAKNALAASRHFWQNRFVGDCSGMMPASTVQNPEACRRRKAPKAG